MSSLNDTFVEENSYFNPPFNISSPLRFWLFLIPNILSILCSIFCLYHFLFDRNLRHSLNNHTIILLIIIGLIMELIDIPLMLQFHRFGSTWKLSPGLSYFWSFIDYGCFTTQTIIFAWSTIERHIIIFHHHWLLTKKKRFFIHYLPLIILLIYCFTYYCVIAFNPSCGSSNFQSPVIGVSVPCIYNNAGLAQWDLICHIAIPTFMIVIFSSSLLLRVLRQKSRLRQTIQWRKQRKIIFETLSISVLYLTFNFPWAVIQLCFQYNLLITVGINIMAYEIYFSYYLVFLFPFLCCRSIPDIGKKLKKLILCERMQRAVGPLPLTIDRMVNN